MDLGPDGEQWRFCWRCAVTVFVVVFLLVWFTWPWWDDLGLWVLVMGFSVLWDLHDLVC
jgi:uncharacterized membrane protein